MKKSLKIKEYIDPNIKVGDVVYLTEGSGLSFVNGDIETTPFIVLSYPTIFKSEEEIKDLPFIVTKTGVKEYGLSSVRSIYIQDIEVEYNGVKMRTCSGMVLSAERIDEDDDVSWIMDDIRD